VIITTTKNAIIHTVLAEIKITIIASAAVIVLIWNSAAAVIAVHREDAKA
jgi:hypothetical protein